MLNIIRTDSENSDFRKLVVLLDKELSIRDGDEHSFYAQFNKIDTLKSAVVAYENEEAVGCGAFKKFDGETIEIKRMYVKLEQRGKGIGIEILKILEKWAIEKNFRFALLETGKRQPEAIRLYEKSCYEIIPNYGQYKDVQNGVCMKKELCPE